jgi:hypothetical protein
MVRVKVTKMEMGRRRGSVGGRKAGHGAMRMYISSGERIGAAVVLAGQNSRVLLGEEAASTQTRAAVIMDR